MATSADSQESEVTSFDGETPADWLKDLKATALMQVYYSSDGKYVAKIESSKLLLASVHDRRVLWRCPPLGERLSILSAAWSNDSKTLIVSSESGVFFIDAATGRKAGEYKGFAGSVYSASWSPDGKLAAGIGSKSSDKQYYETNSVIVWDAQSQVTVFEFADNPATRLCWASDSRRIAFNCRDSSVQIWDVLAKKQIARIPLAKRGYPPLAWSPVGDYLAVGDMMTGEVTIYDGGSGKAISIYKCKDVCDLRWSRDGKAIICLELNNQSQWPLTFKSGKIKQTAVKLKVLGDKGYIPKDLDECIVQLDAELKPENIKKLKECSEKDLALYHLGLGMWIRNSWGLRSHSQLAQCFVDRGYRDADAMSAAVIKAYWNKLNGRPSAISGCQTVVSPAETGVQASPSNLKFEQFLLQLEDKQEFTESQNENAKREIAKRMMEVECKSSGDLPRLRLPALIGQSLRCRYFSPYEGKILMTAKRFGGVDGFHVSPYTIDISNSKVSALSSSQLDKIEGAVVFKERLYLSGVFKGKEIVVEYNAGKARIIEAPPVDGWLTLGLSPRGILAVRKDSIYVLENGKWNLLLKSSFNLPKCALPVEMIGKRIYFRDEGYGEDNKRLSWVDLGAPDKLIFFDKDTGMAGRDGPAWGTVNSFVQDSVGKLWIAAGQSCQSLLSWTQEEGYRIATLNNRLTFDGKDLAGPDERDGIGSKDIAISCVFDEGKDGLLCFGPSGMYRLEGKKLTQLLKFSNAVQENLYDNCVHHTSWIPTHVFKVNTEDYVIGSHWGGTVRLRKDAPGKFTVTLLDEKLGAPVRMDR